MGYGKYPALRFGRIYKAGKDRNTGRGDGRDCIREPLLRRLPHSMPPIFYLQGETKMITTLEEMSIRPMLDPAPVGEPMFPPVNPTPCRVQGAGSEIAKYSYALV